MKFRTIFILFNIVILFSFLFVVFMPLLMAGPEYALLFWADNWYLGVFFIVVMAGLNAYFLTNRKVFELLESEDWPGLIARLENEIYARNHGGKQNIRLLLNTYLVTSRLDAIRRLELWLREHKPGFLAAFSLPLGLPYLLSNDPASMERFYGEFLRNTRVSERDWIRFNYSFALTLQNKLVEAKPHLLDLSTSTRNSVIQLVSAYFLSGFYPADEAARASSETVRSYFRTQLSRAVWKRRLEAMKNNLAVVVLGQLIREAEGWAFDEGSTDAGSANP